MIDIVMMTCERLDLLKRTTKQLFERTTSPYRMHIIDDASTEGNREYVKALYKQGKIHGMTLRKRRAGIPANIRLLNKITTSDIVFLLGDDVLYPQLDPDWLAQGLAALNANPQVGMLALNNPSATMVDDACKIYERGTTITTCKQVGGNVFIRRDILRKFKVPDGTVSPIKRMCWYANNHGWQVAFINDVYVQHIGVKSIRRGGLDISGLLERVGPVDPVTLKPLSEVQ